MKRHSYKFEQASLLEDKFFSAVFLDSEDVKDADTELVDIEMLRVGKFNHKIYGEIDVTQEMLESLVNNFKENVVGRDISFDWNHEAKQASAWLKDVRVEDGVLIGSVDFTESGKKSVESKEYGYFSIEYSDNYIDAESGDEYGPTILGGALTNRPFITKLQKISFEDEGSDFSLYRMEEDMKKNKTKKTPVKRSPVVNNDKTFEEVKLQNEKLLEELKAEKEKNKTLEDSVKAQTAAFSKVEDRLKKLEENNKSLQTEAEAAKQKAREIAIEKKCEEFLANGHHPSVVAIAKEIMLSDESGSEIIKFTETVGEGDNAEEKEVKYSISAAIEKLMEAIPAKLKANYDETTTSLSGDNLDASEKEKLEKLEDEAISKAFSKRKLVRLSEMRK